MAAAGFTPISLYYTTTSGAGGIPSAGNLVNGELAINITDGKLYYKDNGGTVQVIATKATGTIGGSNTQVQYNSSGVLAGSANMTFNGTKLTVAGFLDSALTSGRVPYATTSGELIDSSNLLYSGTDLTVYGITVGRGAGAVATNTAVGASALINNSTGAYNTAVGMQALQSNTTASNNTAVGYQAGYSNTSGIYNTAVGFQAMYINVSGANNTAVGRGAMYGYNGTGVGTHNTAVGDLSMFWADTGNYNTSMGSTSLNTLTTGSNNVAIGYSAGSALTTGGNNTIVGMGAGSNTLGGSNNTFVGQYAGGLAGYGPLTGGGNTCIGPASGINLTSGSYNTFIGPQGSVNQGSGGLMTSGSKNTILGAYNGNQGGLDIRTASNYIVLSDGDGNPRGIFDNSGNLLVGTTSGSYHRFLKSSSSDFAVQSANTSASAPYGHLITFTAAAPNDATSMFLRCDDTGQTGRIQLRSNGGIANYSGNNVNLSDRREKTNFAPAKSYLDTICAIPVQTFNYIDQSEDDPGLTLGVVAQDVQAVAPELVMESNWGTEEEPKMRLSIYQTDLQYALMKCIQELKSELDSVKAELAALKGN